jgi:4-hydroxy-tetrahydrodipicolinate synthase
MTTTPPPGLPGIWPALLTPLSDSLAIDHARFAAHAKALLGAGCSGVTPFGTTGEGPSFSVDERRAAVDALIAGGVPASKILVSTMAAAVPDVIALTRHAQSAGAWGVLLMPPFYFKGVSDAGVQAALRAVIDALDARPLRVVLYHIPQLSGVALSHAVIAELLRAFPERIVAIKDSAGDPVHALGLAKAFMPPLGVHVGHEPDLPALAACGSRGAVSGLANFMPRLVHRLATEPDAAKSAAALAKVEKLLGWLGGYALIPALKGIMAATSGDAAWLRVRPPLVAIEAPSLPHFKCDLDGLGLGPIDE